MSSRALDESRTEKSLDVDVLLTLGDEQNKSDQLINTYIGYLDLVFGSGIGFGIGSGVCVTVFVLRCLSYGVSLSHIVQYPAVVKVSAGENVSLKCDSANVWSGCDSVSWIKVDLRSRRLMVSTAVRPDPDPRTRPCTGMIYNSSTADSGIYYCSVKHSVLSYIGNGSTLIVTDPHPLPLVMLYVPDVRVGLPVSLQCVVMGVVPAEAKVSWLVGESELTGWTESGWTNTENPAEYTRAHLSVPAENWREDQNVECVVEVDGRRISKSLIRGSGQLCSWLVYLCSGVAFVIFMVFGVTLVSLQTGSAVRKSGSGSAVRKSGSGQ
ncbi:hypothetical protein C0J50_6539 [Silurus asotus]|uniref:Ig-like domain-containing protein n=1 Tax=Silurus asotus TaxID=30991 RepID=A0AAD5A377_SILAS|nr:hypothetical protein C0J50_6539 [Silurus asotus]